MHVPRALVLASICCAAICCGRAQTPPSEYATFTSHGKAISCAVYSAREPTATLIFLRGSAPADMIQGRQEARFFADHGYRVLVPDYLSATANAATSPANYRRWAQVIDDIVAEVHAQSTPQSTKVALAGQSLGAAVALLSASRQTGVGAMAEWSGELPIQFFAEVHHLPPLLILHGDADEQVPIMNARQIARLCKLRDLSCETQVYVGEGHVFSPHIVDAANQRALAFFRAYLR